LERERGTALSKRDNPRIAQREAEKKQKRDRYLQAKKTREDKGAAGTRQTGRPKAAGRSRFPEREEERRDDPGLIIGRNPVMEAVKSGRTIEKILMQKDGEGSVRKIASMAREKGLQIQYVERAALDRLCPGRPHQGVAAFAAAHDYCQLEDILESARVKGEEPFLILLDGLEDPHNLGAIMRTADAAGVHGIVIPSRRAVGLTETVAKASAGAIEYVPVAKVSNMVSAIEKLKEEGLWIAACDMDGQLYYEAELSGPMAVVVGGEGQGVSRLVREKCDYVLSIPMRGKISSLNASNAAAILMYEVFRRRTGGMQEG